MRKFGIAILLACGLIGACGGARPASAPPAPVRQPAAPPTVRPPQPAMPEARVLQLPGLEGVIGANAAALVRRFGAPRIDLIEGDVRKLQFSGDACVLDIFLYPPASGGEPAATHVSARRASDGEAVDRAACIAALGSP